ncbi:hypothetical protein H257_04090 [Aphanomyces astaci]|uniref:Uncharacterized protein n=1 Tax=Aphanomyces astaci TaxID=112090 RepID=W4GWD5_APHAT|nr:hypothetical protein H257_04090 [Aphanomyces astaci]ETV83339.1 hypothetical protein H257_04090 [Aphanomyces astaci]|eukprot:XP_009826769.1 hypothetical protein H257_04090 [Aphanomyces astaci]
MSRPSYTTTNHDAPRVTLWTTTYPPQADYLSPSQDTSLGSLVPTHRDIPLHNPIPSPTSPQLARNAQPRQRTQHPEPNPTQSTTHPTFEDMPTSPAPTPPGPAHTHTHPFPHTGSHPTRPPPVKRHHSDIEPDLDFSHPSFHLRRQRDTTKCEVADTTIDDDDQEEYDANTALQFPGIRNLHDEGQPILYRTMQRYWEREAHLFQGFTADDITDVERHFADTKVRIQFSINPSLQPQNDQLSIINYRREIEDVCQEHFGLTFRGGPGQHHDVGIFFLRDISVVMIYQYAGVLDNGLSFHQLEYRLNTAIHPKPPLVTSCAPSAPLGPIPLPPRLPPLTTTDDILAALRGSHLPTPDLSSGPPLAHTSTFSPVAPDGLLRRYSVGTVADTTTRVDPVTASPIWTHGIALAVTPNTQPPLAGTYVAPTHAHAVQGATAMRDTTHIQSPNTPPRKANTNNTSTKPRPGNSHFSATHSRSPDTPRTSISTSGVRSPPSSAAFSTLDARLLEERRLREAAELLQAEDNRLSAEARIRLNTVVTQHESQQAALTARLPYLESSVHTLLQAMQSVSSQMSALAAYPPPSHQDWDPPGHCGVKLTPGCWVRPTTPRQRLWSGSWWLLSFLLWISCYLPLAAATLSPSPTSPLPPSITTPSHPAPAFSHLHDPYSSDDSNNSELLDARIAEALQNPLPPSTLDINPPRQRRRRRAWRIHRLPLPPPDADTARHQLDNILWRESLKGETYIGDPGHPPPPGLLLDSLLIAATNINKNTYGKLGDELATWFRASALDFLIIADSDLPAHKATQLWT